MDDPHYQARCYMEQHKEEIDTQWDFFRERFLSVPLEIHMTEKHCIKKGEETMNETWKKISKNFIESYDAIKTLRNNGVIGGEQAGELEHNLLTEIIGIMKTEVDTPEKENI